MWLIAVRTGPLFVFVWFVSRKLDRAVSCARDQDHPGSRARPRVHRRKHPHEKAKEKSNQVLRKKRDQTARVLPTLYEQAGLVLTGRALARLGSR